MAVHVVTIDVFQCLPFVITRDLYQREVEGGWR